MRHVHEPDHRRRRASAAAQLERGARPRGAVAARLPVVLPALAQSRPGAHPGKSRARAGAGRRRRKRLKPMYVILTSRPGEFRTELGEGMEAVEVYDYVFCGRKR